MNAMIKMWLAMGSMDVFLTLYTYFILAGTWYVYLAIVPTILLLGIGLPLQRIGSQITRGFKKQNGKCYNCNLQMDEDTATLEEDHVYCKSCHNALFGHLYEERGGVWYRKKEDKK